MAKGNGDCKTDLVEDADSGGHACGQPCVERHYFLLSDFCSSNIWLNAPS
jgi:hypothetical protein